MSETVKLIIEISKDYYEIIKHEVEHHLTDYRPLEIIGNGIPLDSNDSDHAEVQAYFAGQTYGWEEGRKDLCDKISAEIKGMEYHMIDCDVLVSWEEVLDIIEKYKEEAEGKEADGR